MENNEWMNVSFTILKLKVISGHEFVKGFFEDTGLKIPFIF